MPQRTTQMLLSALQDGADESSWRAFDARYRGMLLAFACQLGLSEEDAGEATQEALSAFVEEFRKGKFDPQRGELRSWLFGIARDRVLRIRRQVAQRGDWRGVSAIADVPDEHRLSMMWEHEWRQAILREGMRELRESNLGPNTIRAFEGLVVDELDGAQVAHELGMSENAVYQAKFRATQRLREIMQRLEGEW